MIQLPPEGGARARARRLQTPPALSLASQVWTLSNVAQSTPGPCYLKARSKPPPPRPNPGSGEQERKGRTKRRLNFCFYFNYLAAARRRRRAGSEQHLTESLLKTRFLRRYQKSITSYSSSTNNRGFAFAVFSFIALTLSCRQRRVEMIFCRGADDESCGLDARLLPLHRERNNHKKKKKKKS